MEYTLLGGIHLKQLDRMRVTIKIQAKIAYNKQTIRHSLDLYNQNQVDKLIRKTADVFEVSSQLIREEIEQLIELLEKYRLNHLEKDKKAVEYLITKERKEAAIKYLKAKNLVNRTNQDIGLSGVIGEETNRLIVFLVYLSRLRDYPLHLISLGASGSGKTYLQEKIAMLIPDQDKIEITSLTANALYYFGKQELQHKLLLIEDLDGAEQALYPIRELMSKRRISKTVVVKANDGTSKTISLEVEGPVSVAGTTTQEQVYEDNSNRSILIHVNLDLKHQEAIINYQRQVSAGKVKNASTRTIIQQFQDINMVLENIKVVNPYAEKLSIPLKLRKPLRTYQQYLSFIETITFYHQYQRKHKINDEGKRYIESTKEDIELANTLLEDVLLSKADELPGALREFVTIVANFLEEEGKDSFYVRDLYSKTRRARSTVHRYVKKLAKEGYIYRVGGSKHQKGYLYSLDVETSLNATKMSLRKSLQNILKKA